MAVVLTDYHKHLCPICDEHYSCADDECLKPDVDRRICTDCLVHDESNSDSPFWQAEMWGY